MSENDEYLYTNADEAFIQAPLKIGRHVEIQLYDDIDYDRYVPNGDALEFDEDKKGFWTIPKLSSVEDFFDIVLESI